MLLGRITIVKILRFIRFSFNLKKTTQIQILNVAIHVYPMIFNGEFIKIGQYKTLL